MPMDRSYVISAAVVLLVTLSAAFCEDDLTTGFKASFRHAYESGDIRLFESLVCWDQTTAKQKQDMRKSLETLAKHHLGDIEDVHITPGISGHPLDPNIEPIGLFLVYFKTSRCWECQIGARYPLGKKDGKLYIVVSEEWDPVILEPPPTIM